MNAVVVENFKKNYEAVEAVKGVSFEVEKGELFGLIGPDGAGKTTLIRAICTLLVPDAGRILVQGMDVHHQISNIRQILGYMPQRFSLYQDLTVEQNLIFFADLFQVPLEKRAERIRRLYQFSRLAPFKQRAAGALSGGMKQKLALSCALVHTPEILILDEPTTGVDPVSRQEFWEILHSIQQEGTTIVVSTPYMDEANQCDRVALFFKGEITALDKPEALKKQYRHPLFRLEGRDLRALREFFLGLENIYSTQLFGDSLHVSFTQSPSETDWQKWQKETGGNLKNWVPYSPTIEDVFLDLMGENHES